MPAHVEMHCADLGRKFNALKHSKPRFTDLNEVFELSGVLGTWKKLIGVKKFCHCESLFPLYYFCV